MNSVDISRRVSWCLDKLGYGTEQRAFRREANRIRDNVGNSRQLFVGHQGRTVGSKGEGLSNVFESDKDILVMSFRYLCVDGAINERFCPPDLTVLTSRSEYSPVGHVFLELAHQGCNLDDTMKQALFRQIDNKFFMSTSAHSAMTLRRIAMKEYTTPSGCQIHGFAGPAVNYTDGNVPTDFVSAFYYHCPTLLQAWSDRDRPHNWPSPELRNEVTSLGAVIVPTAHPNSTSQPLEWRICFNHGELALVRSLNDTQSKLYVLLKMVKNDVLPPEQKAVTSYVMKNIVFWLAELYPQELFTPDTLCYWLMHALCCLKRSLKQGRLPYYMIPARNLLAGKASPQQMEAVLKRLEDALDCGTNLLFMCEKLHRALTTVAPERLDILGNTRNELEKWFLASLIRSKQIELAHTGLNLSVQELDRLDAKDAIYNECITRCAAIVLPEWPLLQLIGVNVSLIVDARIVNVLR